MDQLRQILLLVAFALAGATSTAAMWLVFSMTLQPVVPGNLATLACLAMGSAGPIVMWFVVYLAVRNRPPQAGRKVLVPATIGLSLALATQLAFYIPLGFFATAFAAL